jgi:hypothetical protein
MKQGRTRFDIEKGERDMRDERITTNLTDLTLDQSYKPLSIPGTRQLLSYPKPEECLIVHLQHLLLNLPPPPQDRSTNYLKKHTMGYTSHLVTH